MKRLVPSLAEREFDLLVIGGGAFGAAAAWNASLRGLNVALIEQADFGGGASAECFKMVHGGIRYLQHLDIRRLRASCAERQALLRLAPHLVKPLPIVVPTFGTGRKGRLFIGAGMLTYDLLTARRNAAIADPARRIPRARLMSRPEVLGLFPELEQPDLTGAAVFADGQMYNAARLVLAYVKSAVRAGATAANYVRAERFLWQGNAVRGVRARDCLDGSEFDVRARLVLNAAGPWAEYLFDDRTRFGAHTRGHFSRDAYFIVNRAPRSLYALAVTGQSRDRDSLIGRATRHLFTVPWRDHTLVGVWHRPFVEHPDTAVVEEDELESWLKEMNASYPALKLRREEVSYAHCGLVPFGSGSAATSELTFGKESRFVDHRHAHGVAGLVTLIGIRFTTARGDSSAALDLLLQQWQGSAPVLSGQPKPLVGGDIEDFVTFHRRAISNRPEAISARTCEALVCNHGSEYMQVLELARLTGESERLRHSDTLVAEVTHAVRSEMALRLEDVVVRRTDLGSAAHPGHAALEQAARKMQQLCGWSEHRRLDELESAERFLQRHHAVTHPIRQAGMAAVPQ